MEIGWPWQWWWKAQEDQWAVAEKLTVLTHDMLRQGSCVSLEIMRTLFQDLCEKDSLNVKLSREWVRAFLRQH